MYWIKNSFLIPLILIALVLTPRLGTAEPQPDPRETAMALFDQGQFDRALPLFSKLSYDYPYDYLLKYYTGACMIETGNFSLDAEKNLLIASGKEVPVKVYYYLGILYHSKSDWNSAQRNYNRFKNNSDPAEVAALKLDELTNLCYQKINPFIPGDTEEPEQIATAEDKADKQQEVPSETIRSEQPGATTVGAAVTSGESKKASEPSASPTATAPVDTTMAKAPVSVLQDSPVISIPPVRDSIAAATASVSDSLALDIPPIQDSLAAAIPLLQDSLDAATALLPDSLAAAIPPDAVIKPAPGPIDFIDFQINGKVTYLVEKMFRIENSLADFRLAREKEIRLDTLLHDLNKLRTQYRNIINPAESESLGTKIRQLEGETMVLKREMNDLYLRSRTAEQDWWNKADFNAYQSYINERDSLLNLKALLAEPVPEAVMPVPVEVSDSTTVEGSEEIENSTASGEENKDTVDPDEIIFKVQLGAYKGAVPSSRKAAFTKISKLRVIDTYVNDDGATVYTTGFLKNFDDAVKLQNQVRLEGIKDAFVIALQNGKRVSLPKDKK